LNKHRISTTISQKYWELLKKQVGKHKTQQKALEFALESLENNSEPSSVLTQEEKIWLDLLRNKFVVIDERSCFKMLMETVDIERQNELFNKEKPVEFAIEYYYQKPLKDCSLKELIDGLVINTKLSNWFDTINYTDEGSHYTMIITHNMGINCSKITLLSIESVFNSYGIKIESTISSKSIFITIFKN